MTARVAPYYRRAPMTPRIKRIQSNKPKLKFTKGVRWALTALCENGEAVLSGNEFWVTASGATLSYQTIEALFARGFVIIVYASPPGPIPHRKVTPQTRGRYVAKLTECGSLLALGLRAAQNKSP